jgi:chitin synthase
MNVPVSNYILQDAEYKQGEEFTHCSYTAVTSDPGDFPNKYSLRIQRYNRQTEIALVITMYNEDDDLFTKSMMAVQKNIAYLCSPHCPFSWGKEGWKRFVVVVVSDGRSKVNPKVLNVLTVMGLYIPGIPRTSVDGKPVTAHVFEGTTQVAVDRSMNVLHRSDGVVPTQVIFLLKEKNAKKINSHKWFFNAVCAQIQPKYCFLLDVGTKPSETAFFHLWRAFDRDPMVGGACGEIRAEVGKLGKNAWLNPLVASQNFEYKMSNILDKPLESVFGYISVLPGAFSAYRYTALKGQPLEKYFHGETPSPKISEANLYLAEDRILCFELVAKMNEAWVLKYVKSARAETDVPDQLDELVSQRRRWLNGSFFASVHALMNFTQIYSSPHSTGRKVLFTIEFIYNLIQLLFSWFSLGTFYLTFHFLFLSGQNDMNGRPVYPYVEEVFQILRGLYIFAIISMFVSALGNRPQGTKWLYRTISALFSFLMLLMLIMGVFAIKTQIDIYNRELVAGTRTVSNTFRYLTENQEFRNMVISLSATYVLYLFSSILHLDPWHIFTSMFQYLLVLPTYNNIFMIYSFCNLHEYFLLM